MKTLHVEISLCQASGAAGWGATFQADDDTSVLADTLAPPPGGSTAVELAAVEAAVGRLEASGRLRSGDRLEIAMRSTAALSVLRWVFPEAAVVAAVDIPTPKKISAVTRELTALYDLSDTIEHMGVEIVLRHAAAGEATTEAQVAARAAMESARLQRRRA